MSFDDQRWLARVTYFDNNYEDQVAFQFSPGFGGDGIPDFLNIAGSQANGIELEAGLQRPIGGALVHESELARNDPTPPTFHLPVAYDAGLPSPVI